MTPTHLKITEKDEIKAFLNQPLMARIATADPSTLQPHTVPVWYEWDGDHIWISSFRSTRKVKEIRSNPLVSVVVDSDSPHEPAQAVLFEGSAELITDPQMGIPRGGSIYARYLGQEGALGAEPQSWLHDPEHLLIRVKPSKIYAWGFG
jgi:nitroimidazol reductase NimA-like FMN-containing flavoprotein (pyridoxamine 5'-phosphate oxidase superfamily)